MANYLPIYHNLWTSTKFHKLDTPGKLVYIYLLTSKMTQQTGIFNVRLEQIACDCDIEKQVVAEAIAELQDTELIRFWEEDNLVFVHKMFGFTKGTIKSPKIRYKTILRQMQLINNHEAWQLFQEENLEFYEELREFEDNEKADTENWDDS